MNKELYVSTTPHETKVALVEDDQLAEVYFERENEYTLAGSIYKGRVTRVLPGMQSAFVDIGLERDAFLYVSDFLELQDEDEDGEFGDVKVTGATLAQANGLILAEPQPAEEEDSEEPRRSRRRRRRERPGRGKRCWRAALARTPSPPWQTGRTRPRGGRASGEAQPGAADSEEWTTSCFRQRIRGSTGRARLEVRCPREPRKRELRGFEPRGLVVHGLARSARAGRSRAGDSRKRKTEPIEATKAAPTGKPSRTGCEPIRPCCCPASRFRNTTAPRVKLRRRLPQWRPEPSEESDRGYGRGRDRDRDRDRGGRGRRGDRDRDRGRGREREREPREPREAESSLCRRTTLRLFCRVNPFRSIAAPSRWLFRSLQELLTQLSRIRVGDRRRRTRCSGRSSSVASQCRGRIRKSLYPAPAIQAQANFRP